MNRGYAVLEVKTLQDEQRTFTGVATTPATDRMGDQIDPMGAKFKNPLPLLHQHNSDEPIGTVRFSKATEAGIEFEASIPRISEAGPLKDRVDTAWGEIKAGLVRAVSIGFRVLEDGAEFIKGGGILFKAIEIIELSAVTIPANAQCTIQTIKSFDDEQAASGQLPAAKARGSHQSPRSHPFGWSSCPPPPAPGPPLSSETSRGFRDELRRTDRRLRGQARRVRRRARSHHDQVGRGRRHARCRRAGRIRRPGSRHRRRRRSAQAAEEDGDPLQARPPARSRATPRKTAPARAATSSDIVVVPKKLPPGTMFARYVGAMAASRGNRTEAAEFAKQRWGESMPALVQVLRMPVDLIERTAVNAGTTSDATWASPLVQYQEMASEFIEYLRPQTVIGKLTGLRRVPFKVRVPRQTGGATVNWVGETKIKPLTSLAFDSVTLDFAKVAGIVPLSEELVKFSSPAADELVRSDLAKAIAQFLDHDFLDSTKAANDVSRRRSPTGRPPTPRPAPPPRPSASTSRR
jgi:HK97 family phage major capsid protein/HK97 family phage prohead protease